MQAFEGQSDFGPLLIGERAGSVTVGDTTKVVLHVGAAIGTYGTGELSVLSRGEVFSEHRVIVGGVAEVLDLDFDNPSAQGNLTVSGENAEFKIPLDKILVGANRYSSGVVSVIDKGHLQVYDLVIAHNVSSDGTATVASEGKVDATKATVGQSGEGYLNIDNATVTIETDLVVGAGGIAGVGPAQGNVSLQNGAQLDVGENAYIGDLNNSIGKLNVSHGTFIVRGILTVGDAGKGNLYVIGTTGDAEVDVEEILRVGSNDWANAEGKIVVSGGKLTADSIEIATDHGTHGLVHLKEAAGKATEVLAGGEVTVGGERIPGPNSGRLGLAGLWIDGGFVDALAGGVTVNATGLLSGEKNVKGNVNVNGGAVAAGAVGGIGTIGALTIDGNYVVPSAESTLRADISGAQAYDNVLVTADAGSGGNSTVGGKLVAELQGGYVPAPWRNDGSAGHYFMLVQSDASLAGAFADPVIAPPVGSLNLPPPEPGQHYSWKVIYDRTDAFDSSLANSHPAFASQPWAGNGTKDVVLLIIENDIYQDPPPYNQPPVAYPDSYVTPKDQPLSVASPGVLGNDTDPNQDLLSAEFVAGPSHGAVTLNADGSFVYTPDSGYVGGDSFTYQASDGEFLSNVTTVSITVLDTGGGCTGTPLAVDDWYAAVPMVFGNVLDNDSDPTLSPSRGVVTLVAGPSHAMAGSFTLEPDGDFTYTMESGFTQDFFTYQFTACGQTSNVATVTLEGMAEPLLLDQPPVDAGPGTPGITQADLDRLAREAARRWILAGFDPVSVHRAFYGTSIGIADLPGSTLGLETPGMILIDVNAAGHGWFVDATPRTDGEFGNVISRSERQAASGSAAYGRADLLTALMHEFGHTLGLVHLDGDEFAHSVMNDTLSLGTRRLPTAADILAADEYFAELWQSGSTIRRRRW